MLNPPVPFKKGKFLYFPINWDRKLSEAKVRAAGVFVERLSM
jgi:hypothetical protein